MSNGLLSRDFRTGRQEAGKSASICLAFQPAIRSGWPKGGLEPALLRPFSPERQVRILRDTKLPGKFDGLGENFQLRAQRQPAERDWARSSAARKQRRFPGEAPDGRRELMTPGFKEMPLALSFGGPIEKSRGNPQLVGILPQTKNKL